MLYNKFSLYNFILYFKQKTVEMTVSLLNLNRVDMVYYMINTNHYLPRLTVIVTSLFIGRCN